MKRSICLCILLAAAATAPASAENWREVSLPDKTRYVLIGATTAPAPLLVMLQGNLDDMKREPLYTAVARKLAPDGFLTILIDAPAHGPDARPAEPAELAAWAARVDAGEELIRPFVARVRAAVDDVIRQQKADPHRLFVAGTSRGGFLAFHVAANDPRFRAVGAISPVTDLNRLREFAQCKRPEAAAALSISNLAPRLAGRPVWISIGNHDERVGTDAAITAAQRLVAASLAAGNEIAPVDLIVHSTPGHRSSERDHERLAAWIRARLEELR